MKHFKLFAAVAGTLVVLSGASCQLFPSAPASRGTFNVNAGINSNNAERPRGTLFNINGNVNLNANLNSNANVNSNSNVNANSNSNLNANLNSVPASKPKTFNLTLSRFKFEPSTITVNRGDTVIINATATDTAHGLNLPDYNINLTVPQGQTVSTSFLADKQGTFAFSCSVYCGGGHAEMKGTLVVK